jgi:AraC-like DNA-binding protein
LSRLLVVHQNHSLAQEQEYFQNQLQGWNIYFLDAGNISTSQIELSINKNDIHFLLISDELKTNFTKDLNRIHNSYPLISIIYYYPTLKNEEFAELYKAGISYCIIGDSRQFNLIETLHKLWDIHWKRIPVSLLPADRSELHPRADEILHFIENNPIKYFNTSNIAKHLNISESHFRIEFKKCFILSFREFKQRLLFHYETILLFDNDLKPKEIFEILDYKSVAAFSRSFKIRHGKSWQDLIRV